MNSFRPQNAGGSDLIKARILNGERSLFMLSLGGFNTVARALHPSARNAPTRPS